MLTRYACYLIGQNRDPKKPEIAYSNVAFAPNRCQRLRTSKRLNVALRLKIKSPSRNSIRWSLRPTWPKNHPPENPHEALTQY